MIHCLEIDQSRSSLHSKKKINLCSRNIECICLSLFIPEVYVHCFKMLCAEQDVNKSNDNEE